MSEKLKKRFEAKVLKTDHCWIWTGHTDRKGYGRITVGGKGIGSHRISWTLYKGEIPAGMFVCHHCDNPPCVNPDHLFIGTILDNNRDKVKKGRAKGWPKGVPCNVGRLTATGTHLSESEAREIIRLRKEKMKVRDVANLFGISTGYVSEIANGNRWASLQEAQP